MEILHCENCDIFMTLIDRSNPYAWKCPKCDKYKVFCEICEKPATVFIQDIARKDNFITAGFVEYKPFGPRHFFCEEHKRDSIEIDITESPLMQILRNEHRNAPKTKETL